MLRFAPSTENGLPLIWARPRFCEDTFFRLNKEESKKVAGEHVNNAKLYEFVKGFSIQIIIITAVVILSVSEKAHNIPFCIN